MLNHVVSVCWALTYPKAWLRSVCNAPPWKLTGGPERHDLHEALAHGQRAVSASYDQTLKVWDLGSGRELRTLPGHARRVQAVAVTPDGRRAVSASDDHTLKVWDLETGEVLA
jgi:WD40 repeat protein